MEAAPGDATARYNLAESCMAANRTSEALLNFDKLSQDPIYATHDYVHLGRGILRYNRGEFEAARDAYRRAVELRPTGQSHLFLADAHRQLGDHSVAREHYLHALHNEPTLVEAHRGYWHVLPRGEAPQAASSLFDRGYAAIQRLPKWTGVGRRQRLFVWWLRRHYKRHPEDTRIHFMLGAHALLTRDLEMAEERLQFAIDVFDGVDYEARSRLAIVYALQGRFDDARVELERVRDMPSLEGSGAHSAPSVEEQRRRAVNFILPFLDDPSLAAGATGARIYEVFAEVFEPAVGPIPELTASLNASDKSEE